MEKTDITCLHLGVLRFFARQKLRIAKLDNFAEKFEMNNTAKNCFLVNQGKLLKQICRKPFF